MMNVLKLKNDLHRMVVETEDADMLAEVRHFFDRLKSNRIKTTKQQKKVQKKESRDHTPDKPAFLSDAFIYEKGRWVYAGKIEENIDIDEMVLKERYGRDEMLVQNL
ncbi:MAG: hypothetical protein AB8G22_25410 [Saprospiraceae bacterium]